MALLARRGRGQEKALALFGVAEAVLGQEIGHDTQARGEEDLYHYFRQRRPALAEDDCIEIRKEGKHGGLLAHVVHRALRTETEQRRGERRRRPRMHGRRDRRGSPHRVGHRRHFQRRLHHHPACARRRRKWPVVGGTERRERVHCVGRACLRQRVTHRPQL